MGGLTRGLGKEWRGCRRLRSSVTVAVSTELKGEPWAGGCPPGKW